MERRNFKNLNIGGAGIRGIVGPGLTPANAGDFAAAYGTLNTGKTILVGIDPRGSSPMLEGVVTSNLCGCGCHVITGGILTAGMMHFLILHRNLGGGILISGGHQGAGWNALVPLDESGAYYEYFRQRELFDLYHGKRFYQPGPDDIGSLKTLPPEALDAYWNFLASQLNVPAIAGAGIRVVADFCNGAGAAYGKRFAELLHIDLVGVNDEPCALIPRDPEPRPRSESLIRSIIEPLGANIGLVFNRDCSRLGIVSDRGEPLSEEMTFPLGADYFLESRAPKGSTVVTNVCSSRSLDETVRRRGGILVKCRVGQSRVIDRMRSAGAVLGGEGCGCFTTTAIHGFDGFLMAGILLESIAVRKQKISEQIQKLARYNMVKQTIPCNSPNAYRKLRQLCREFEADGRISEEDGLRFDWNDGFLSLRLSNTEALLRLISESTSRELAEERAWKVRQYWERSEA